jgi:D-3-phosphoglycerate dehydrogenase
MTNVLITTVPFGQLNGEPLRLLAEAGFRHTINPLGRRPTEAELADMISGFDVLIAGTEPITERVMEKAPQLRLISRVGIGLDNVDLLAARARGIAVAYTPDAPSPAVAELTIGLMLALLRGIHHANALAHAGTWQRVMGRRLAEITVGVIGVGRVGGRLLRLLEAFGTRVLAHDVAPSAQAGRVEWTSKEQILREADIVTLHVPLTAATAHLIGPAELALMKPDAFLVNTARGGVVDEAALAAALRDGRLAGAAVDVFATEPYSGELAALKNCLVTCHMGSMSEDCRFKMEYEAVVNAMRFVRGEAMIQMVPESEYALRETAPTSA